MSKELNNAVDKIVHTQGMVSPMRRAELLKILRPIFEDMKDQSYTKGWVEGFKSGSEPLSELVKIQKELIAYFENECIRGDDSLFELYLKIDELEK